MTTPWKPDVRPPRNGESVSEANAARGHRDSEQRSRHLKERMDAMEAGRALILYDQPLAAGLQVSQPVYQDDTKVWRPALASGEVASDRVSLSLDPSALGVGIVLRKTGAEIGDVAICGMIDLTDVEAGFGTDPEAGLYYLAMETEGKLVTAKPSISVPVLSLKGPDAAGVYTAYVFASPVTEIESHQHIRHPLSMVPAGTANCVPAYVDFMLVELEMGMTPYPGITHEILEEDSSAPGWLPADSEVFTGLDVPSDAKFGYNLEEDPVLSSLWPPLPTAVAYLEVNGRGASQSQVVINSDGIWWLENKYGRAPWSPNHPCSDGESSSSSLSGDDPFRLEAVLWFTRLIFSGGATVLSLKSDMVGVEITDLNGVSAAQGDLKLVEVSRAEQAQTPDGKALRAVSLTGGKDYTVPAVNRLKVDDPEFTLEGATPDDDGYLAGSLVLRRSSVSLLTPDLKVLALNNAEEITYAGIQVIKLPLGVSSAIRMKFELPPFAVPSGSVAKIRWYFTFLSLTNLADLTAQGFELAYRILPRADGCTATTLPTSDTALTFAELCSGAQAINTYVEASSEQVTVESGDVVYLELSKDNTNFDIGIIRVAAALSFVDA